MFILKLSRFRSQVTGLDTAAMATAVSEKLVMVEGLEGVTVLGMEPPTTPSPNDRERKPRLSCGLPLVLTSEKLHLEYE